MALFSNKRRVFTWIAAVALMLALVCFGIWLVQEADEDRVQAEQRELQNLFHAESASIKSIPFSNAALAEEALPSTILTGDGETRTLSDGFTKLYEINPDVIGWISGGGMDTAVVYRDNEFYLDHDFYGKESTGGTVFADEKNSDWENDRFLVLYGHNMKNGSMFAPLKFYRDAAYLDQNPILTFTSVFGNAVTKYVPYALLDASMEPDNSEFYRLRSFELFDFLEPLETTTQDGEAYAAIYETYCKDAQAFIDEARARSFFALPTLEVTPSDRILVLTTCSYELENARLMLFCRALRSDESVESIVQMLHETAIFR